MTMKSIKTAITINAPAETIWNILAHTAAYPTWNPLVVTLNGELKEGNNIEIHVSLGKDKPSVFKPRLLVVKKDTELRWIGSLFVKGVHEEVFTGMLSSLIFGMIGKDTLAGFNAMNEALKHRAEAMNG